MYCKRDYVFVRTVSAASEYPACKPSDILGNIRISKELKEQTNKVVIKNSEKGSIWHHTN